MRTAASLMLWLLAGALVAGEAPGPLAGTAELDQVEAQIDELAGLLERTGAALERNHRDGLAELSSQALATASAWHAFQAPLPTSVAGLQEFYAITLPAQGGFDPLQPSSDFQHRWQRLRREEHHLHQVDAQARRTLAQLIDLRTRLRAQLHLPAP